MNAAKLNWNPIRKQAIERAKELGHALFAWDTARNRMGSPAQVKTAMCETCGGCCWISWIPSRGFAAGGRLLKYQCGTPEAMGMERAAQ